MNHMAATRNRNKWARQRRRSGSSSSRSSSNAILCDENQEIYNKNECDYYTTKLYTIGLMTYNSMANLYSHIIGVVRFISKMAGIYIMWIGLHYVSAHLYTKVCAPETLLGFIMSPLMVVAPHCRALRWVVYTAAGVIDNMWLVFGTWICANILPMPGSGGDAAQAVPVVIE
jgi:hypothetical protein